jgi:hypothetical protein
MTSPVLEDHRWPEPGEHLWGRWSQYSRTHRYRQCAHPDCSAVEIAPYPKGA